MLCVSSSVKICSPLESQNDSCELLKMKFQTAILANGVKIISPESIGFLRERTLQVAWYVYMCWSGEETSYCRPVPGVVMLVAISFRAVDISPSKDSMFDSSQTLLYALCIFHSMRGWPLVGGVRSFLMVEAQSVLWKLEWRVWLVLTVERNVGGVLGPDWILIGISGSKPQ